MISTTSDKIGNVNDLEYKAFRERVKERFATAALQPLFMTDVDLWPIYLDSFPPYLRQHHDCSACRHFIRSFGGLAIIGENGNVTSALWNIHDADDIHMIPLGKMQFAVNRATVTGVFLTSALTLGQEFTKQWAHLSLRLPGLTGSVYVNPAVTPHQKMCEKSEDHKNVLRALGEFPLDLLDKVVELLKGDALFRAEKVLGPAQFLRDLAAQKGNRSNLVWRAIATAPAGFCHPRSSMVGTLLEDLAGGMAFDDASKRFRSKMHPLAYQRPTAAPSQGQIRAAEDLVDKLGIASSLPRRFARLEDVEKLWIPTIFPTGAGVFGHLLPSAQKEHMDVAEKTLTWTKFQKEVLPEALTLEVRVPDRGNFIALVTAQDPDAPPILQWDSAERRNPVSWYLYSGGSVASHWNLSGRNYVPVTAVTLQPSMWGPSSEVFSHQGQSVIFILKGAKDSRYAASGGALFPETLRSELHGARSVIEAYSRKAILAGYEESSACGLRLPGGDVTVRTTTKTGTRFYYKIDRWD